MTNGFDSPWELTCYYLVSLSLDFGHMISSFFDISWKVFQTRVKQYDIQSTL